MDTKPVRFQLVITIYVPCKVRTLEEGKTCNSFWLFSALLTDILKRCIKKLFISSCRVNRNYELNLAEVFSSFKVMVFSCFYSIQIYEFQQNPHTFSKNKGNIYLWLLHLLLHKLVQNQFSEAEKKSVLIQRIFKLILSNILIVEINSFK